jgi:hypothetical protein
MGSLLEPEVAPYGAKRYILCLRICTFTAIPGASFRGVLVIAPEDTVSGSKRSDMVIDMALWKQLRATARGRILILRPTPIVESNVEPKRAP